MSDELIVAHCAPTLAGLKTGNLFSCRFRDREEILAELRRINRQLAGKGIAAIPLGMREGRALIYLYRPAALKRDLSLPGALRILRERGYGGGPDGSEDGARAGTCSRHLARLIRRLKEETEFPHEIGLFLGYPPEDVAGFIENRGACCKCIGTWKVYGDPEEAQLRFRRFRSCTDCYLKQARRGRTLAELSVAM